MATEGSPDAQPVVHAPRPWLWAGAAALLLVPALAMQVDGSGVDWALSDFVVMGALLALVCALYEVLARRGSAMAWRLAVALALGTAFVTVWVNLAVGMLGDEAAAVNRLFAGVLAVAVAGAVIARRRALAMARAMVAAGVAQLLAVGVAPVFVDPAPRELLFAAAFALPWFAAAALFRHAAQAGRAAYR